MAKFLNAILVINVFLLNSCITDNYNQGLLEGVWNCQYGSIEFKNSRITYNSILYDSIESGDVTLKVNGLNIETNYSRIKDSQRLSMGYSLSGLVKNSAQYIIDKDGDNLSIGERVMLYVATPDSEYTHIFFTLNDSGLYDLYKLGINNYGILTNSADTINVMWDGEDVLSLQNANTGESIFGCEFNSEWCRYGPIVDVIDLNVGYWYILTR